MKWALMQPLSMMIRKSSCRRSDRRSSEDCRLRQPGCCKGRWRGIRIHGSWNSHTAKVSYSQMQTQMNDLGYANVFIGTVEGELEETACEEVIKAVAEAGYTKVVLRPLMVVAGDHANNDMAGEDEGFWLSQFNASGKVRQRGYPDRRSVAGSRLSRICM